MTEDPPPTSEIPIWRPRPEVPQQEQATTRPVVGPRQKSRHQGRPNWAVQPMAGLVVGLILAACIALGITVGHAVSPAPETTSSSCVTP